MTGRMRHMTYLTAVALTVVVVIAAALWLPLAGSAQPNTDQGSFLPPFTPNATFGQRVLAAQVSSDTILDEPISMLFSVVGFGTEKEAVAEFQPFVDYYIERAQREGPDNFYDYSMISIGRIGDDRAAFVAESEEFLFGSSAKDVHILIRVGTNILYVWSVSLGGEAVDYVANYLDGLVVDATSNPASLLPELADLPVGWELLTATPENFLQQVTTEPTPTPLPTPTPAPTPIPTPVPVQGQVDILLDSAFVVSDGGSGCQGTGEHRLLSAGRIVRVSAESEPVSEPLATYELAAGTLDQDGNCLWTLLVGPLPKAFSYYFHVGIHTIGVIEHRNLLNPTEPVVIQVGT